MNTNWKSVSPDLVRGFCGAHPHKPPSCPCHLKRSERASPYPTRPRLRLPSLFDSIQSLVQANNVSSEILAVRASVLVGTDWLELVVSSDTGARSNETDGLHVFRKQVAIRP
jgi:hypothetical protein